MTTEPQPPADLVEKAHAIVGIIEVVAGIQWDPRPSLRYDPSLTHYLGEDGFLVRDVAVTLFHLTEDDYELVGATRRFAWAEFPDWIREWYIAENKYEFGDDWEPTA